MFEVYFSRVCFVQAAKYLFIVECGGDKKRTHLSQQVTSNPTFDDPVELHNIDHLIIKACIVTHDKQLKIIGSFEVHKNQLNMSGRVLLDQDQQLKNRIQGQNVCTGRCRLRISMKIPEQENRFEDNLQIEQTEEIESEKDMKNRKKCEIRILIHCGFNFYIGSSFRVQIKWGRQIQTSKPIKDKITTVWAENMYLEGSERIQLELSVIDSKENRLEWFRIPPKSMRIMFPYHIRCIFREEFMAATPEIYFTAIREDVPLYTILERQVSLYLKPIQEALETKQVNMLCIQSSAKKAVQIPQFISLNLKDKIQFDYINERLDSEEQHWVMFVPVAACRDFSKKDLTILKSLLSRNINAFLIKINDWKQAFLHNNTTAIQIIEEQYGFETVLKQIYYHDATFTFAKKAQVLNFQTYQPPLAGKISPIQKWRILSHNYQLRTQMVKQSNDRIWSLKPLIEKKGAELVELKKVLKEVQSIHVNLKQKAESALTSKTKGLKVLVGKYDVNDIISTLYEKLQELTEMKKITCEIRMRIDTVVSYDEDFEQLDQIIVENAQKILNQHQKIAKMSLMKDIIERQRIAIGRLEKIFEQRELDKEMNELLEKEYVKLEGIRKAKRDNLAKVYETIISKSKPCLSVKQQTEQAEKELIRLNEQYAKLKFQK